MASERHTVPFRGCECPGTPHPDGDVVYLRPTLGFAAGAEILRLMGEAIVIVSPTGGGADGTEPIIDTSRTDEIVGPAYILHAVVGWNVEDEDGPVDYDPQVILDDYSYAQPVATECDALYSAVILAPLLLRMSASSGNGPTGGRTPRTPRSPAKARSPRKSSSANGSAGPQSVPSR